MAVYDKVDWHLESALEAGQPAEHAGTHIGLFLGWLARRELLDTTDLDPTVVAAVRRGELRGSVLLEAFDDKLLSLAMSFEGDAFAAARYHEYTAAYDAAFADRPDYSVADDAAAATVVDPILDALYGEWVASGRPQAAPPATVPLEGTSPPGIAFVHPGLPPDLMERAEEGARILGYELRIMPEPPPPDPDLAALVPAGLTDPPMRLRSHAAIKEDKRGPLRRALERLGIDPRTAVVLTGVGGRGRSTIALSIHSVPGVPAADLADAFEAVIAKRPSSRWTRRTIADRDVHWVTMPEFTNAFWTRESLVVSVGGDAAELERVIPLLP